MDIVDQLRRLPEPQCRPCKAAADEIERLRALVDSLLQERLQAGRQAVAQEPEPTREQLYSFHHRLMAMGGVVGRFWGQ
jgi:hypothetical protein